MDGAAKAQPRGPTRRDPPPHPILSLSVPTPLGRVYMAASERGLVRIELPGPNAELRMNVWIALHFPSASIRCGVTPILKKAAAQVEAYFTGGLTEFSLPLHIAGTPFQRSVWREVARVPFAETRTYREIAAAVNRPTALRAVGTAQGANPLPIVVPCHRVIGSDGSLAGYGGGIETKRWLLEHEADLGDRTLLTIVRTSSSTPRDNPGRHPSPRPTRRRPDQQRL